MAGCGSREPLPAEPHAGSSGASDATLRRGLGGDVATFDPQKAGDQYSDQVARELFEGLTAHGADGQLVPGAAESWEVSDDGLAYTFRLRDGLVWSNGEPVVADDFVAGLRRAVTPATGAPLADSMQPVENAGQVLRGELAPEKLGVSAPDPRTVVVRLVRPAPYLLDLLANPIAFPVHRGSLAADGTAPTAPGRLVSNGPYVLERVLPGDRITLVRNARYRDAAGVAVARVEYFPIADVNAELLRYRAGELDMTSTLPASQLEWARRERPMELQIGPMQAIAYVVFDTAEGVLAGRPELREALSLVIDREAITGQVLKAGQLPWYSMVPPGLGGYEPVKYAWAGEGAKARSARARGLLAAAGYGPAKPLKLRFLHHQNESLRNTALAIGGLWKEHLGVEVSFDEREFRTFLEMRGERGTWDVLITALGASYQDPGTFLSTFRGGAPDNDSGLKDAEFDSLLTRAEATAEPAARRAAFSAAEERLLDAYAATPVYLLVSRRMVAPRVRGAVITPTPTVVRYISLNSR
jgi:oligopeptide transport system substrate-binding protein